MIRVDPVLTRPFSYEVLWEDPIYTEPTSGNYISLGWCAQPLNQIVQTLAVIYKYMCKLAFVPPGQWPLFHVMLHCVVQFKWKRSCGWFAVGPPLGLPALCVFTLTSTWRYVGLGVYGCSLCPVCLEPRHSWNFDIQTRFSISWSANWLNIAPLSGQYDFVASQWISLHVQSYISLASNSHLSGCGDNRAGLEPSWTSRKT